MTAPRLRLVALASCAALALGACGGSSSKRSDASNAKSTTTTTRPLTFQVAAASWKLPAARTRAAVAMDGNTIVLLGGQGASRTSINDVTRIDATTGKATAGQPLKAKLHDAAAAALPGAQGPTGPANVFFIGGGDATETATVELLIAGAPAKAVGKMPQARADLGAVADGTTMYAVAGYDGKTVLNTVLKSTDGVTWAPFATLEKGMRYPAVTIADGALWVFGGSVNDVAMTAIQRVDLASGTVSTPAQLPVALSASAAVTVNGAIVLAGGRVNDKAVDTVWRFDPATNLTVEIGKLPAPVSNHVMVATPGLALVLGGEANKVPTAAVTAIRVS